MITVVFGNESYLFIIKSDCELVLFAQGGLCPQSFKFAARRPGRERDERR